MQNWMEVPRLNLNENELPTHMYWHCNLIYTPPPLTTKAHEWLRSWQTFHMNQPVINKSIHLQEKQGKGTWVSILRYCMLTTLLLKCFLKIKPLVLCNYNVPYTLRLSPGWCAPCQDRAFEDGLWGWAEAPVCTIALPPSLSSSLSWLLMHPTAPPLMLLGAWSPQRQGCLPW